MELIGEKINGVIPAVGRAIAERDGAFIGKLAHMQQEAGADYLDVCAAVRRGEAEALAWLIDQVQAACALPLCLDSPDPRVLLQAMDQCRVPGILNSVSLAHGKAEELLPAIAGTQWKCIGLLCEKGIPGTADSRLEVLDKLLERADRHGVFRSQLYIDPMVEMACMAEQGVTVLLRTIREIRNRYPDLHLVCAISNVSFQMPARSVLNQAFLPLALEAGADTLILDPCSKETMGACYASQVLLGRDPYCTYYLQAYRENQF